MSLREAINKIFGRSGSTTAKSKPLVVDWAEEMRQRLEEIKDRPSPSLGPVEQIVYGPIHRFRSAPERKASLRIVQGPRRRRVSKARIRDNRRMRGWRSGWGKSPTTIALPWEPKDGKGTEA